MRKIVLHRPAADNAANFCDAGAELIVSDKAEAKHISAKRADELLATGGAVTPTEAQHEDRQADEGAFDPAPFTAKHTSGGRYLISGPGLDEPEKVAGGKAAMQARVRELQALQPPPPVTAPNEGGGAAE